MAMAYAFVASASWSMTRGGHHDVLLTFVFFTADWYTGRSSLM
jgi:hypothetical protein